MTSNADRRKQNAPNLEVCDADGRDGNPKSLSAEQAEKNRRWLIGNANAIHAENAYIEKHGLPLATSRLF
jgi:hypothetical protein